MLQSEPGKLSWDSFSAQQINFAKCWLLVLTDVLTPELSLSTQLISETPDHPTRSSLLISETPDHTTRSSQLISEDTRSSHAIISAYLRRHQILPGIHLRDTRSSLELILAHLRRHPIIPLYTAHLRRHQIIPRVHLISSQKAPDPPMRSSQLISEDT